MRRTRGFTLIELMIATALGGLVIGGAIELHISFNRQAQRQQAITEVQQSLRVSMMVLERAIRTAGQGLPPSTHAVPGFDSACVKNANPYFGFQYSNSNTYADPQTVFWTAGPGADTDPDWFRVIAADNIGDYGADIATITTPLTSPVVTFYADMLQNWAVGDLVFVQPDLTIGALTTSVASKACATPSQVTVLYNGTPTHAAPGSVTFGSTACYNQVANNTCFSGNNAKVAMPLRHISTRTGITTYRIMPSSEQGGTLSTASPKLTMRSAPFRTAVADANFSWTVVADNIEDMQIAVILADGTVCNYLDNPAACSFADASAVRITLVGRSAGPIQGATYSPPGGYEDEQVSTLPNDSFIRRSMTTTIVLRNFT
jgi:prepilin-type N-terminal cleavage/methylation domain-containing protein